MAYADVVLVDSPLGYWRMEETSGTTCADSSGNGRNGTYVNGPRLDVVGPPCLPTYSLGLRDGSEQRVEVPHTAAWNVTTSASWEAWVLLDDSADFGSMLNRDSGAGFPRLFQWRIRGFDDFELTLFIGGTAFAFTTTGAGLNDAVWHHLVTTYDGSHVRFYKDGALFTSFARTGSIDTGTLPLWIGGHQGYVALGTGTPAFYNGRIDEVAFYNTVLSADRVLAHYDAGRCRRRPVVGFIGSR